MFPNLNFLAFRIFPFVFIYSVLYIFLFSACDLVAKPLSSDVGILHFPPTSNFSNNSILSSNPTNYFTSSYFSSRYIRTDNHFPVFAEESNGTRNSFIPTWESTLPILSETTIKPSNLPFQSIPD
jgi:hypothetical protein